MAASKYIDRICAVVLALTLALTVLFVNGKAIGLEPAGNGDAGDGPFTANDLDGGWDSAGAARIALTGDGASVTGYGAYYLDSTLHIISAGRYILSGSLTDGSVVVEAGSSDKVWLLLDNADIRCEDGAALLVEQAGKVFLTLAEGTENTLSSGANYSQEAASANIDGTVYSRDDLTINGGGSLTVTSEYQHAIVCNDDFVMTGGTVTVQAPQDGIHANDSARFCNMDLTITAGDDGITVSNDAGTSYFYLESGRIAIPACYEGVEAVYVAVAGGSLDIVPADDGINATGGGQSAIYITGGSVSVVNNTGRDADGLDSNGSIYISGGSTFLSVSGFGGNCAVDYGSENGGTCQISGGTVIAAGGSALAESFDSTSPQGFIMYSCSGSAGAEMVLRSADSTAVLSGQIPCAFTSLLLSAPELQVGDVCTLSIDGVETELVVDNTSAAAGMFGGMFGGGIRGSGTRGDGGMRGDGGRGQASGGMVSNWPEDSGTAPEMPEGTSGMPKGVPEMPGEMPEMPDGTAGMPEGMPEMPGGTTGTPKGMPEMPDGTAGTPEGMPEMPVQTPEMPEGATGTPEGQESKPDGTYLPGQGMSGGGWRGGLNGQSREMQNSSPRETADTGTSAISPGALALVALSALVLLAGILFAWKVKHFL